jgi:hypothetical protein
MTTDLIQYKRAAGDLDTDHADAKAALAYAGDMSLNTDADAEFAAEVVREVKAKHRELDDRRKQVVSPLNEVVKTINSWFKPPMEELERVERALKSRVAAFVQRREAEARAALEAACAAETPAEAEKVLALFAPVVPPAGTSVRMTWRWRVVNEAAVPRELLSVDPGKVGSWMRGSTKDQGAPEAVSGLEFYQEPVVSVRR